MTVQKFGSFADISPLLDRQIEELVAATKEAQEELGLTVSLPTAITALTTTGGWGTILLNYSYTSYNGHLYTEVWRSDTATFEDGERTGATVAKFYNDSISGATLSDVYYYWVRNVNIDGDVGDWYGPASGSISAESSFNVDDLLGSLGFEHFAPGTYPIRSEAVLPDLSTTPATYPVGSIIYLTTNQLLYKNVSWVWEPIVSAEDMIGEITETQISDGAITTPKLTADCITSNELTTNAVIAGQIAAGALVVDDGVMQNGYIKTALIGDAAITNAKIDNQIYSDLQYVGNPAWELNKDGHIIIRGTDGSVIFQSGGTLDFSNVVNGPPADADATDYTAINVDIAAAQAAAQAHADAQDVLYETVTKAYADGIVTDEEARAIADATAKANAAQAAAEAAAQTYTQGWSANGADVTASAISATTSVTSGGLKMTDISSGDYVHMTPGELQFYQNSTLYKFLRRIDNGVASTGSPVTFSPAFNSAPQVIVSPYDMPLYDPDSEQYDQRIVLYADSVQASGFTPMANLVRSGSGAYNENVGNSVTGQVDVYTAEYTTTRTDVTQIKVNMIAYWRSWDSENGYYTYSTIKVDVEYKPVGGSWAYIVNDYTQYGGSPFSVTKSGLTAGQYVVRAKIDLSYGLLVAKNYIEVDSVDLTTSGQPSIGAGDVYWWAIE